MLYTAGLIWQCCEKRGNLKCCQTTIHKGNNNPSVEESKKNVKEVLPIAQKRKAEDEPPSVEKRSELLPKNSNRDL